MRDQIEAGSSPYLVASSDCITSLPGKSSHVLTVGGATMTYIYGIWASYAIVSGIGFHVDPAASPQVNLQMQDLPRYQTYKPGCATSPSPAVPLPLPSLVNPIIYYVVGYDTGIKSYPLTPDPAWALLSTCQVSVLSYSIGMQDGSALPNFLTLIRSTLAV